MLSCIRHGVLLWGPDSRLLASNAIAAELLHHPPGLLVPGQTQEPRSWRACWRAAISAAAQAPARARAACRSRPVQALSAADRHPGERVLDVRSDPTPGGGWVTTFTDVTEAQAAEDGVASRQGSGRGGQPGQVALPGHHEPRAAHAAQRGDRLLRRAAARGGEPSRARVAEFAQQINEAGRHLLGLINIILDVARIESGRFDLASDKVDVGRLVRICARQSDAAAQAAEITLVTEVPDDLPPIRADERRLQQVLNHLLSNAVKFTEAGGTVSVGASLGR